MKKASWMFMALVLSAGFATADEKEGISLTVYPDFGVVHETRNVDIPADGKVTFADVAGKIDPTTVRFESLTDPEAKILEQNYQYDLVNPWRLLEKYLEKPISVRDDRQTYSGPLLSFSEEQLILKDKSGLVIIARSGVRNIRFGAMPEGLRIRPTLLWKMAAKKRGKHLTRVSYQTNGLTWYARYSLIMDRKDSNADLSGWVSVKNNSGKTYRNAKLKFVAGDICRISDPDEWGDDDNWGDDDDDDGDDMHEKAFFEYHMYTLQRPSTLADNEIKQLEMFTPARGIKVAKRYLYNPLGEIRVVLGELENRRTYGLANVSKKVNVFIEFTNSKKNKLGIPLPAGIVRVYKEDPDDKSLELVGEQRIDHTPTDEKLSLQVGSAFDVVGERRQTDFKTKTDLMLEGPYEHLLTETIEIKVRNRKRQDVTVRIKEPMYRYENWKITEESHPKKRVGKDGKLDSRTVAWDVPVKAGKEVVLTYTVRYMW